MKKRIFFADIFATALALLFLPGCKKLVDYVISKPGGIAKNCKIEVVTVDYEEPCEESNFSDTAWFSYNRQGGPVAIKYAFSKYHHCLGYGIDKAFNYDHKNRLVVYLDGVSWLKDQPVGALSWHKYTYANGDLVIDSAFGYADGDWTINGSPEYYSYVIVTTYELDDFGRVVKEMGGWLNVNITYDYDQHGNLIKPGVSYSNKTNIRQTSEVWMFLDKDYSINSPVGAASQFNQWGLPVKLNEMPPFIYSYSTGFNNMVVRYECK